MLLVSASYGNTEEKRPLSLLGCRFMERNRAVNLSSHHRSCSTTGTSFFQSAVMQLLLSSSERSLPWAQPVCDAHAAAAVREAGTKTSAHLALQRRICARVLRVECCAGCSSARCVWGRASAGCLGSEQHCLGQLWAGKEVRPCSIPVVGVALLPGGDLLLLLCGCLHCQGTGSIPNILLFQQEKVLGCSKLFWLQKTQRWRGYHPQPIFSFLAPASAGGYLLSASISAWLATL